MILFSLYTFVPPNIFRRLSLFQVKLINHIHRPAVLTIFPQSNYKTYKKIMHTFISTYITPISDAVTKTLFITLRAHLKLWGCWLIWWSGGQEKNVLSRVRKLENWRRGATNCWVQGVFQHVRIRGMRGGSLLESWRNTEEND